MNKTNSIVEINGNRYDAITGKLIGSRKKDKHPILTSGKKVMDGFSLGPHHSRTPASKNGAYASRSKAKNRSKTAAQGLHIPPEKPRTLIRKGLKKPVGSKNEPTKQTQHRGPVINPVKQLRSKTVERNTNVNRFGHFKTAPLAPIQKTKDVDFSSRTVAVTSRKINHHPTPPSMITSVSHHKLENMLDEALLKANAHQHMMNHKPKRNGLAGRASRMPKWLSFSMVGFVLAATAAFLIYQNLPAVAVHLAASKAHVNASMPGYTPTGYGYVGPLTYGNGAVTMHFADKLNPAQRFSLTQKSTNLNSSALETTALPSEANVQSSQVNGTTVYIYGDSNDAMWVNRNVLYSLKNTAELSSDQVLRIVQGL